MNTALINRRAADQAMEVIRYNDALVDAAIDDIIIALDRFGDELDILDPAGGPEWIQQNIRDPRDRDKLVTLYPHQVKAIEAQLMDGVETVVIVGIEQGGKSACWQFATAYKMVFIPAPRAIVYEEKNKAAQINERRLSPIVNDIPQLTRKLSAVTGRKRRNSYHFGNEDFCDFTGAGADFTSQSYRDFVLDETDTMPLTFSKKLAQIKNADKRRRTYMVRGEGTTVSCSSIKGGESDSAQWQLFLDTNMSFWHLFCLGCDTLTIPSHDFNPRKDVDTGEFMGGIHFGENYRQYKIIDPAELRVQCPVCGYMHTEADLREMNRLGDYIAQQPEITTRHGYLFGGLACPDALRLIDIAESMIGASRSNEYEVIRTHYNSVCGIAVPEKQIDTDRLQILESHCAPISEDLKAVVLSADTQESPWGWYYVVRGIDARWNTYLLKAGFVKTKADLEAQITARFHDLPVTLAIIDQGGTNAADVKDMAINHANVWQYKGASKPSSIWQVSASKKQTKLVLCDASRLQVMLLRAIYDQQDRSNNYMFLPPASQMPRADKPEMDYTTQMLMVRDLQTGDKSRLRVNWSCKTNERRDYFDAEKMLLVLLNMPLFKARLTKVITTGRAGTKLSELQREKRGK